MSEEQNKKEGGQEGAPKIKYVPKEPSFPMKLSDLIAFDKFDRERTIWQEFGISEERSKELFLACKEVEDCSDIVSFLNAAKDVELRNIKELAFFLHAVINHSYRHYIDNHLRQEIQEQMTKEAIEMGRRFEAMVKKDPSIVEKTFGPGFKKDHSKLPDIKKPDPKDLTN